MMVGHSSEAKPAARSLTTREKLAVHLLASDEPGSAEWSARAPGGRTEDRPPGPSEAGGWGPP